MFISLNFRTICVLAQLVQGILCMAGASNTPGYVPVNAENLKVLSLPDAIALAVKHHPRLAAYGYEVEIVAAEISQAGLRPNPQLELETESFGGSGPYRGLDEAETTVTLSQTLESGGKRSKRQNLARTHGELTDWNFQAMKLEVIGLVRKRYLEVQAAEEQIKLTGELTQLAQEVYTAVSKKVEAGKVAPLEQTRARVALAEARLEQKQAANHLFSARLRLASTWGSTTPDFTSLQGNLPPANHLPDPAAFNTASNPLLTREDKELVKARAALALERATGVPDLDVKVGWKRFEDTGDVAFTLGVGVELPIFNRNKYGVQQASLRISQAGENRKATALSLDLALQESYASLKTAFEEAALLSGDLLPAAEWAFHAAREGYRLGKFGYLDVADAQRSLFQIQRKHIDALAAYHLAFIEMTQLAGRTPDYHGGEL